MLPYSKVSLIEKGIDRLWQRNQFIIQIVVVTSQQF